MPSAKLPKPVLEIITARTIDPLIDLAVDRATLKEPWTILVPRSFIKRDMAKAVLAKLGHGWLGPRILTVEEILTHYSEQLDGEFTLTPLQAAEAIEGILRSLQSTLVQNLWPGALRENQPDQRVVQSLTKFCLDLDATRITAPIIQALIDQDPNEASANKKRLSLLVYTQYQTMLDEAGFYPATQGRRLAADKAKNTPLPEGVNKILVVGADGIHPNDPLGRLLTALAHTRAGLSDLAVALVAPSDLDVAHSAWGLHGNDALLKMLTSLKHKALDLGEARHFRPAALDALAYDPTAYRFDPVPADRSVRVVRLPDAHLEAKWVAQNIKRHIVEEGVSLSDIAVIGRSLGTQSSELTRIFQALGIPVVASFQSVLEEAPAIQALLSLHRLAAGNWSPNVLMSIASSPYIRTNLAALLIQKAGRLAPSPTTPDEWQERLVTIGAGSEPTYEALAELAALLQTEIPESATPRVRVEALRLALEKWQLEDTAYDTPKDLPERIVSGFKLTRQDLDALNALLRGTDEWLRGRQLAGRLDEELTASTWLDILERITSTTNLRLSTYTREAVNLLDPHQAIGRTWSHVYVLGLTDGVWPPKSNETWAAWPDDARRSLLLPNLLEEEAHERLLFHLTCASATKALVCSWSALDRFGSPSIPTSYLAGLDLRLAGLVPEIHGAQAVLPVHESQVTDPDDEALVAALSAKNGVLLPWMATAEGQQVQSRWAVETVRSQVRELGLLGLSQPQLGAWAGYIPEVMSLLASPHTAFSPTELALYDQCHLKFYLTRLAHALPLPQDTDPNEEAALGTIQHAVLYELYTLLAQKNLLPVRHENALQEALQQVEPVALRILGRFQGRTGTKLWHLDSAPLVDVLKKFVIRDLSRQLAVSKGEQDGLMTTLVALEDKLGLPASPIAVNYQGETWYLTGVIDRVEKISDSRLDASPVLSKLQNLLIIYDYKTTRSWARKPAVVLQDFLRARKLQLPLYAHLASQHYGVRVFAYGELLTGQNTEGPLMAVRHITRKADGNLIMEKLAELPDVANPVDESVQAALAKATGLVQGIRAGDFTPQPERNCWDCPFTNHCRASKNTGARTRHRRAPLPVAATMANLAALQSVKESIHV